MSLEIVSHKGPGPGISFPQSPWIWGCRHSKSCKYRPHLHQWSWLLGADTILLWLSRIFTCLGKIVRNNLPGLRGGQFEAQHAWATWRLHQIVFSNELRCGLQYIKSKHQCLGIFDILALSVKIKKKQEILTMDFIFWREGRLQTLKRALYPWIWRDFSW